MASTDTIIKVLEWSPLVAITAGGVFFSLLVDYVTPGRKGKLRTERDHFFPNFAVEDVRKEMEKRLVAENFELEQTNDPNLLRAHRKKRRPKDSVMRNYPFENLKLDVEVRFTPREDGVIAKMAVGTPSTITRDTGESTYLEAILDYIMLRNDLTQVGPVPSTSAHLSLYSSILYVFLPFLFFLPGMLGDYANAFIFGLVVAAVAEFVGAGWGILQVLVGQGRYSGIKPALIAIVLTIVGAALSIAFYMMSG